MTKQEMLYEQYNDALFRLLMHSVAQHQGQQYQEENQALKAQEDGPSETAKRRCLRTISRQVRRGHARAAARTASRVLSKAAVVMLLVISCLTAAFAVSPVFRSDALRWDMSWWKVMSRTGPYHSFTLDRVVVRNKVLRFR